MLGGAEISPLTGNGTLTNLTIGNPAGWNSGKAFSFGKVHVEIEPSSLFKDHVIVKEVLIEKPEIIYVTKLITSNIGQLVKQLEHTSGHDEAAQAKGKDGKPLKFAIRHLAVTGGLVTLGIGPTAVTVPLPPIELNNLGGDEGMTSDQIAVAVMRAVSADVLQVAVKSAGKLGSDVGSAAGGAASGAVSGLKGLLGK